MSFNRGNVSLQEQNVKRKCYYSVKKVGERETQGRKLFPRELMTKTTIENGNIFSESPIFNTTSRLHIIHISMGGFQPFLSLLFKKGNPFKETSQSKETGFQNSYMGFVFSGKEKKIIPFPFAVKSRESFHMSRNSR